MSQENVSDKVRNLQRQIAEGIKFGQRPPSLRRSEGDEGSSDEEEVPQSPLKVSAQMEAEPAELKVHQAGPPSTPVKSPRSRRVLPPTGTIESINLDAVPQAAPRLDNTAARHKLSVKPKNQRLSRKHLRFTQDVQEGSIPGVVREEPEDQRSPEMLHEEERRELEEEERRKRAAEELRLEEERCRKQREEAERRMREEEESRMREEEEEEERRMREEEEERRMREEERRMREEEEEQRRQLEEQKRKQREEEDEARRQRQLEVERKKKLREEEEDRKREEQAEKRRLQEIETAAAEERMRKEQEEQRWREMEERQRPFSFKVSSGEKQILFQKVHLTPVTPASAPPSRTLSEQLDSGKASSSCDGPESPNLPTSPYVPHTAILVTGAQLCGTAVNLDQIRDSACMSLLGLGDDRKAQGTPPSKTSPDRKSGKTKSLNESSLSTDQSVLAEWASIRSKIFKGVEEGKYDEYPEPSKNQPGGEDPAASPHTNLRKTMSASAKFSITPAKKKFGDSNRNSEVFGADEKEAGREADPSDSPAGASPGPTSKPRSTTSKSVRIAERGSDGCMFAKDLPSFLVPSPGANPEAEPSEAEASEGGEEAGFQGRDGEDMPSPFGIKLRRTNFSLRFHSEQSAEKRKKRYSAGDSFDGVPSPLTPIEPDSDASSVFSDKSTSPTSPQKDAAGGKQPHASASHAPPRAKLGKSTCEVGKVLSKPPVYRRPTASPRACGAAPTPPPSPLPKAAQEATGQRTGGSEEPSAVAQLHRGQVRGEEEPKEKRSFFPSINIPWREKTDQKTELKKDKPSLQSRHSLDGSKAQEKEAGPLWITLALQKQKGFREQQQNREDRRSHRENKAPEKQTRDRDSVAPPSPTESKGSSAPPPKPPTPEEPRRPDSLLGRFERREHLKKANTLPSSVTVEIADSTPSPPAVTKRFPSGDPQQVSTEPAWLALAKRKAKAWSDCPQIIK
uniref:capping protein inhibiting regulator of actin dynamics isoform X2 n=1 Tax=Gasterosteus aculeatus aculeatus TaxID=481459 RepID=UPI001A989D95|nr:capping protein inhibiting regulator of actin dynamics isoform X2 [Gasterosteus aculeatus aculeatus]